MKAESLNISWDILNPAWIFGPIFDKELRVSSRRKKNYNLRSFYIFLLCLLIFIIWLALGAVHKPKSALYQASRSAEIGRVITIAIVWCQFIFSQLIAIVFLSSSISDEIRSGSLNVLMTTPVNNFQIVTGKLFSKLLQIFLLLAISLPLLAIIRLFGGISWDYILLSFCTTISAVIFTGSLSLLLSVFYGQAYRVIVLEAAIYLILFVLTPILLVTMGLGNIVTIRLVSVLINPFYLLFAATQTMSSGSIPAYLWMINCIILICFSCIWLGISIRIVRSAALRNISPIRKNNESRRVVLDEKGKAVAHYYEYQGNIKRVTGSPIIWKEMYKGFLGENWASKIIYIIIALGLIATSFSAYRSSNISRIASIQIRSFSAFGSLIIYLIMSLRLAATSASSIAREKEGRTLSILLVSPISDKDIVIAKVKAAILKNIPLFALYIIPTFIISFSSNSFDVLVWLLHVPLSMISIAANMFYISCCGVYYGIHSKNSTAAIVATIISYFLIVYVGFSMINFVITMVMSIIYSANFPRTISWYSLLMSIVNALVIGGLGWIYLRKAERKLRKSIF